MARFENLVLTDETNQPVTFKPKARSADNSVVYWGFSAGTLLDEVKASLSTRETAAKHKSRGVVSVPQVISVDGKATVADTASGDFNLNFGLSTPTAHKLRVIALMRAMLDMETQLAIKDAVVDGNQIV